MDKSNLHAGQLRTLYETMFRINTKFLSVCLLVVFSLLTKGFHATNLSNGVTDSSSCPELEPNCTCNGISLMNINCRSVEDLAHISQILKQRFSNVTINHVEIRRSKLSYIPAEAFAGLTIRQIFLQNDFNLESMDETSFDGIKTLYSVKFKATNLTGFPIPILKYNLIVLQFAESTLTHLDTEIQNMTSLQFLMLYNNKMETIHPDAFDRLYYLEDLQLQNNYLETIEQGLFRNTKRLTKILLSGNRLTNVNGRFDSMGFSLEMLWLDHNTLTNIDSLFTTLASSLTDLYLGNNLISTLKSDTFGSNYRILQNLNLSSNLLSEIIPDAFHQQQNIMAVSLKANNISYLSNLTFLNQYALQSIDISENYISDISGLFSQTDQLQELHAQRNHIQEIAGQFDSLRSVRLINLQTNNITVIRNSTFLNNQALEYLLLSENRLEILEPEAFLGLESLVRLELGQNRLKSLGSSMRESSLRNLRFLWINENNLTNIQYGDLDGLLYIHEIKISNNRLTSLEGAFYGLNYLENLYLRSNHNLSTLTAESQCKNVVLKKISLAGNRLACDCRILWLVERISSNKTLVDTSAYCHFPESMYGKKLKDLKVEDVTQWPEDCPNSCQCTCQPTWADFHVRADCSKRNLSEIPMVFPAKTDTLDLSHNRISEIPTNMSEILPNLQNLFIQSNELQSIGGLANMSKQLKTLHLAGNRISHLYIQPLYNTSLQNVTLSLNPWICDCDAEDFYSWLLQHETIVTDANETTCAKNPVNGNLQGRRIVGLTDQDICPSMIALYASVAIAVLAVLFLCSSATVAYIRYRMPIKVWLYTHGICACLKCIKEEDIDEDKVFDGFIASSEPDFEVAESILFGLEQTAPNYRLCYHKRDFMAGSRILQNIELAVRSSKKVIVLLSRAFLVSPWSLKEFELAYLQMMDEGIDRIILVVIEDDVLQDDRLNTGSEDVLINNVSDYIKSNVYSRWNDKYFWEKLYYAMPRKAVPESKRGLGPIFIEPSETTTSTAEDSLSTITAQDDDPLISA